MQPLRVVSIQHVDFEGPGYVRDWAATQGALFRTVRPYAGEAFPSQSEFDWLILMGGPMGVRDGGTHRWLTSELKFVEQTIAAGKTVVGICLGGQIIAHALGASVRRNRQLEIGWFPIRRTAAGREAAVTESLPDTATVFHWHGDTFDIPVGAVNLYESDACEHQMFCIDERVVGIQFHFEVTPDSARGMVEHGDADLALGDGSPFVMNAGEIYSRMGLASTGNGCMRSVLRVLFDRTYASFGAVQK